MRKRGLLIITAFFILTLVATLIALPASAEVPVDCTITKIIPAGGPQETFTFECWRDLNNNGVIDTGDLHVADLIIDTSITNTGTVQLWPLGVYVIHEVLGAGSAYAQADNQIASATCPIELTFENLTIVQLGEIQILKKDAETGEFLAGACFSIDPDPYGGIGALTVCDNDSNDADIDDGQILLEDVPYGTYVITETTAPDGYMPGPPQSVEVNGTNSAVEVTFLNTPEKPSTILSIGASAVMVAPGGSVDLYITECNDGNVPLSDVSVVVTKNGALFAKLVAPPDAGDDGNNTLDPEECWKWTIGSGPITVDPTMFIATGNGTDPDGNFVTYPGDEQEQDDVTVEVRHPANCRITGGGTIGTGRDPRVTHGFELHCNAEQLPNNLEVNWGGNHFHLELLTAAECWDDPAIAPNPPRAGCDTYHGWGVGKYNGVDGYQAEWIFTDAGEPGRVDWAWILITAPDGTEILQVSGFLDKGNQQFHNCTGVDLR